MADELVCVCLCVCVCIGRTIRDGRRASLGRIAFWASQVPANVHFAICVCVNLCLCLCIIHVIIQYAQVEGNVRNRARTQFKLGQCVRRHGPCARGIVPQKKLKNILYY